MLTRQFLLEDFLSSPVILPDLLSQISTREMLTRQFLLEDFLLTGNFRKPLGFCEFASAYFEPCNPGRPALRKWWHTILERFRVFFCFWEENLWFSVPVRHSKFNLLSTTTLSTLSVTTKRNWPFPSSKNSYFRNEAKFKTFLVKMKFICMRIKNYFHINGFTLSLALKQRLENDRLKTKIWK